MVPKLEKLLGRHQRKLKLPVKALQALIFLIMLSLQQCASGQSQKICFGPVWKTHVYTNEIGFVTVNPKNKQIYADSNNKTYMYKISTTGENPSSADKAFYLFEPNTQRFLCWKELNGPMTTMTHNAIEKRGHWPLCKFSDNVHDKGGNASNASTTPFVKLHLAGHDTMVMQFDKKGRSMSPKRLEKCHHQSQQLRHRRVSRHRHPNHGNRCTVSDKHIVYFESEEDCCSEAYAALCMGNTQRMPELKYKCAEAKSKCEIRPKKLKKRLRKLG
ncbi:uncharacterized protein [Euwallacea similis]|uniref:uncharacterized protein isoform X1 n=1 Tax=Euwallacea similis TaxID=1736056 RepID=UPI00344DE63D